ncbi:GlsB/YeaQ/YmgE family stress response membrane protein [Alkalibacterium kapii]|uniref:Membrane protein n=1 Tax=Alkalibacterium kapii TaxID=426704 RepID=A0A511ATL9_9LACT|nr:GlsB/YeaQ/YmgE family stress response membrane protein [Alkalibacterium kapii]GEK91539.1 membrane protein [Alkalibacterium kapii]
MLGFIWSLIIGGIIGAIGQAIVGTDVPGGIIGNIIIGFIGAWAGQFLFSWGPQLADFYVIPAIIGAIIVVFLYGLIASRL